MTRRRGRSHLQRLLLPGRRARRRHRHSMRTAPRSGRSVHPLLQHDNDVADVQSFKTHGAMLQGKALSPLLLLHSLATSVLINLLSRACTRCNRNPVLIPMTRFRSTLCRHSKLSTIGGRFDTLIPFRVFSGLFRSGARFRGRSHVAQDDKPARC